MMSDHANLLRFIADHTDHGSACPVAIDCLRPGLIPCLVFHNETTMRVYPWLLAFNCVPQDSNPDVAVSLWRGEYLGNLVDVKLFEKP